MLRRYYFKFQVWKYFYTTKVLSFVGMSDWGWVEGTWNINFNSEVVQERQVNFLNQPSESWSWENAFKRKCLIFCQNNYEVIGSGINWPPRFSNVSRVVADVPANSKYRILLILRQIIFWLFNIYEIRMYLVVDEYEYMVEC